jgi:hypothetical protein
VLVIIQVPLAIRQAAAISVPLPHQPLFPPATTPALAPSRLDGGALVRKKDVLNDAIAGPMPFHGGILQRALVWSKFQ